MYFLKSADRLLRTPLIKSQTNKLRQHWCSLTLLTLVSDCGIMATLQLKDFELAALAKHIIKGHESEYKAFADCYKNAKKPGQCEGEYNALSEVVQNLKAEANERAEKEFKHLEECLHHNECKHNRCREEQHHFDEAFPAV